MNKLLQFLGLVKRAGKLSEGYNKCDEMIEKGKVHLLIVSEEASQNTKDKFERICTSKAIPLIQGISKEQLGACIGRAEMNVLGVTDLKMSEKILQLWSEVNAI